MTDINLMSIFADGSVELGLDFGSKKMDGMAALFQRIVLKFLKSPGADALRPNDGGGLQGLFLGNTTNTEDLTSDVADIIRRVRDGIILDQTDENLPDSERLYELTIRNVSVDHGTSTLNISVYYRNALQQEAVNTLSI
jgi:hypothetical protein